MYNNAFVVFGSAISNDLVLKQYNFLYHCRCL